MNPLGIPVFSAFFPAETKELQLERSGLDRTTCLLSSRLLPPIQRVNTFAFSRNQHGAIAQEAQDRGSFHWPLIIAKGCYGHHRAPAMSLTGRAIKIQAALCSYCYMVHKTLPPFIWCLGGLKWLPVWMAHKQTTHWAKPSHFYLVDWQSTLTPAQERKASRCQDPEQPRETACPRP